jgi:hypothetical protein
MTRQAHPLSVVRGEGRRRERVELGAYRLRPCERPAWVDLRLSYEERTEWRCRAAASGLSVDVWVALQVEWTLVAEDIGAELSEHVVERAKAAAALPTLAPTEELRNWVAYLVARSATPTDDLPSLALPQRLLARLRPADLESELRSRSSGSSVDDAVALELAASSVGMTFEAWAYRETLRISSR